MLGSSLKVFGFRLYWSFSGRLVGMEVLQDKLMLTVREKILCLT